MNFACKKFDLDDVIRCGLALSRSEFRLLKFLIKNAEKFSTQKLSAELNLDKSTIQRSIKKLHGKGLVFRSQINNAGGGYVYLYNAKHKAKIKEKILEIIRSWNKVFENEIKNW